MKTINSGKVLLFENAQVKDKIYYVWYCDEHGRKVIISTAAFDKTGCDQKLDLLKKLLAEGKLKATNYGIGSADISMDNFVFGDEENGFLKKYSSPSHMRYAKTNMSRSDDDWENLCTTEFIVLDTETTGISNLDEVIQVAGFKVQNYEITDTFQRYIIPKVPIHPQALAIHGITKRFLDERGESASVVFKDLMAFIGNLPIAGHNVAFDKRKIEAHAYKIGMKIDLKICFDTLLLSKKFMNLASHRLEHILDTFELREGLKSHDAMDDSTAVLRYAAVLRNVYKKTFNKAENLF